LGTPLAAAIERLDFAACDFFPHLKSRKSISSAKKHDVKYYNGHFKSMKRSLTLKNIALKNLVALIEILENLCPLLPM